MRRSAAPCLIAAASLALTACGGGGDDDRDTPVAKAPACTVSLRAAQAMATYIDNTPDGTRAVAFHVEPNTSRTNSSANPRQHLIVITNTSEQPMEVRGKSGDAQTTVTAPAGCGGVGTLANRGKGSNYTMRVLVDGKQTLKTYPGDQR